MRYLLLIHSNEREVARFSDKEMAALMGEYVAFLEEIGAAGVLRASERLRPTTTATTVRVREGRTLTTDGPFAETKEALGGFFLVEVDDLDQALHWAAKLPSARFGSIEVRPIWEREEYMPS